MRSSSFRTSTLSVRSCLALLGAACVLPGILLLAFLILNGYPDRLLMASSAALLAGGLWMAWKLTERIGNAMDGLLGPALKLGSGNPVIVPPLHLKEADEVGRALISASHLLLQAKRGAHYDLLTGLANRSLFNEMLDQHLAICGRGRSELSVLHIELDEFNRINDLHGHATSDDILRVAAARIKGCLRDSDVSACFGGDEFAVLLVHSGAKGAQAVAEKLAALLSMPYRLQQLEILASASIGIATFPGSGASGQALLECSDAAMYAARNSARNGHPGHCAAA